VKKTWFVFLIIIHTCGLVYAQKKVYKTKMIVTKSPVIDGYFNESVWDSVDWSGNFIQRAPHEGNTSTQKTQFKILYDDKYLYVAIRAFENEPSLICRRMSRRDGFAGDWVEIHIDSYFDHRTSFGFTACASGALGDFIVSEDGKVWDINWNSIWYLETVIDELGWTAEIKIPFSQLRFGKKRTHVWGIQIMRYLVRENEESVWQYIPRNVTGWASLFGELHGLTGIRAQRQKEFLPYILARAESFQEEENNPFATGSSHDFQIGIDGKIGLSSDFTLDFAINPDFGQVEADPSEVNLTVFETFFEEKRPFFIEGRNIFSYPVTSAMWGSSYSSDTLFYSRRIGRTPHLYMYSDTESMYFADNPDITTILGALKITGKTKRGLSIGILEGLTAEEKARVEDNGVRSEEIVEPLTNYFVARIQQDFHHGNTILGGMFTSTNREKSSPELDFLHRSAYTGGLDIYHRWFDNNYYFSSTSIISHVWGDPAALYETQTSSVHYFQRPDAQHLSVEEAKTSMTGHGGTLKGGKSSGGRFRFETGVTWRSPEIELNDIGYLRSADEIHEWIWVGYHILDPFSVFNTFELNFNETSSWDFGRENLANSGNVNAQAHLKNHWFTNAGFTFTSDYISNTELRGGPSLKLPGDLALDFQIQTDNSKKIKYSLGSNQSFGRQNTSKNQRYWFNILWRPIDALSVSLNPSVTKRFAELEYVATVANNENQDRYIFADINQTTFSVSFRIDYCLTPEFSIQAYIQPFLSAGRYDNFKRITDPRARHFSDRFALFESDQMNIGLDETYFFDENSDNLVDYSVANPDFNVQYFISNMVIRWEYSPGSTIYVVWTQGREKVTQTGIFSFDNDLRELFSHHPHNVFLVKLNYWLSF